MKLSLSDLLIVGREIDAPEFYACKIKEIDSYYGYLAWAEILPKSKSAILIRTVAANEPNRPEALIKLWNYYYYEANNLARALEVIETAYLAMFSMKDYETIISLNYSKTLHKVGKIKQSIELLQIEYNRKFPIPLCKNLHQKRRGHLSRKCRGVFKRMRKDFP